MLKFFRKTERTRNFILLIFVLLLALSLVAFYAPTGSVVEDLSRSDEVVARVGSEKITTGDVVTYQESLRQFRTLNIPSKFIIDQMVNEKVSRVEAERLGLLASDGEIAETIRKNFAGADGKGFDQNAYEQNAIRQAGSVSKYEESLRDALSKAKLNTYITAGITVSEKEVLDVYKRKNAKFDLAFVPISTADVTANINPSDDEIKAYFEENKQAYFISDVQKKIRYIYLDSSKIGETLSFSDEELKETFDAFDPERKLAGVRISEIVLRISKPELDAQVLQKANGIVDSLKKGEDAVTEDAFADAAKGQSEKLQTSQKGGVVEGLVRRNPNNPTDPYQRVISLREGEVTAPIKFGTNYYILRRGESVQKTFEVAKQEILASRRNTQAYQLTLALAGKVAARLKDKKDTDAVAQEFAAEAKMDPKEMVRETDFVKPGDEIDKIGISQDFEQGILQLAEVGAAGEPIGVDGGFAVPLLVDKKDPRDAELAEVRSQVIEAVKNKQASEQVELIAKRIAENAGSIAALSGAASAEKLQTRDEKEFALGSPLGEGPTASSSTALEDAIYSMKEGEVTKTPIKVGDNWLVVGMKKRTEANLEDFAKERDDLTQQNLQEKRDRLFSEYLDSARQKMEANGEIKIFEEVLKKIDKTNEENNPPTPQFPQPGGAPLGQGVQIPQPEN